MFWLKTLSGRSVTVTPEHPMLTPEGFVRADELEVGSDVASVSYLPEPKKAQRIPDHHVDLLAVLLAEGGISGSNLKFSTTDPEILDIMVRACDLERCDVKPISGPDYRISEANRSRHKEPHRAALGSLWECRARWQRSSVT